MPKAQLDTTLLAAAQPLLTWPGRNDREVVFTADDGAVRTVPPARIPRHRLSEVETHGDGHNLLIHGENYHALTALCREGYAGTVKLIYIDPPFNTGRKFEHYHDLLETGLYLSMLRDRLRLLRDLLAPDGSIMVHLDDRVVHLVRLLLDELFGPENYRNSVITKRVTKNVQRQFREVQALPRAHDVCLLYSKRPATRYPLPLIPRPGGPRYPEGYWKDFWSTADRPTMRYALLGVQPACGQWKWCRPRATAAVENYRTFERVGQSRSLLEYWRDTGESLDFIKLSDTGRVSHWVPPDDQLCADTLWNDFSGYSFRQGFPTEKSERLLERVLGLFSQPGDLVLDAFAGSGTTGAVAARLGRRWILIERGEQARTHIVPRLLNQGAGFRVVEPEPVRAVRV